MARTRQRGRPKAFNDKTEQNTIRALDRAMVILRSVGTADGLSLSELAERTEQSASTVYRVLTTLEQHGMVAAEPETQLWRVGAGAFRIGSTFLRQTNLTEQSRAVMSDLMRQTGETANLGIERNDEVLFLSQVETHEAIRGFFPPGTQGPLHASGIGKALLAHFPADRVNRIIEIKGLAGFTSLTLTSASSLLRELKRTRERGYAIDDQERAEGMRCVAAPVFNVFGEPVAGISVSGPAFRMTLSKSADFGILVKSAAEKITASLGG